MCYSCLYVEHHLWLESSEAHGEFPSEKHYWTLFISWREQSELHPFPKLESKVPFSGEFTFGAKTVWLIFIKFYFVCLRMINSLSFQ